MKKRFTFLLSALFALILITQPTDVWAQKTDNNYTITFANNANSATGISSTTNASTVIADDGSRDYVTTRPFTINSGNSYYGDSKDCIRIGKQSNSASITIALSNTGKVKATSIVVNCKLYNSSDPSTLTVNNLTGQSVPSSAGNVTFTYNSATDIESITLAVTKKIFVYSITVNYTTGGGGSTASNLALTGAPIALSFDLYNNSTPRVIDYTTSSTGAITVSSSNYITTSVNTETKKITVTPEAVTPSTQTITVNQAADATYAAGSVTFTVSISDSSPTPVWALTDIEDLTTSDIFVIVGRYSSTNYSMTNNGGTTRPTANSITISNNMIDNSNVADNIKWNISGNETNGYVFYPNGSSTTWLYNTDNNDGVKVGTGTTKAYTYNGSYLSIKTGTTNTRYLSYYSNQWRSYTNTNSAFTVTFYKRAYPSSIATPTLSTGTGTYIGAQNVTIECETDNVTIYYTLDGSDPTDSENEGREIYTSQLSISTSTTLKAAAYKDSEYSWIAKAKYTIVQPYTSIEDMFNDASATPTDVYVKFNNWVVTGVSNDYAYVTDGTNGFIIKQSSHGFAKGNKISGTTTNTCSLDLHHGYARIQGITNSTTGLSVTTGGSVEILDVAMSELTGVNTGALISYHNLTYNETNGYLEDGNGTQITPYNQLYNYDDAFEDGETYHVTGVFQIYDSKKEILPREASDIVLAANISDTDFSGLTTFTYVVDDGPSDEQSFDMIGENFVEELTVTASDDYVVSNDNTSYDKSTTFTPDEGIILDQTLYVRLKADLGTGPHNGTLTFTSENMTTIVLNLEGAVSESQTYAISLVQTTGGTIAADMSVASEGTTVTLSYSDLDDCYDFTRWTVYKTGDQSTTEDVDENGQFEMPGYPVTATATFTQKTYTLDYYFNGNVVSLDGWHQDGVTCGTEVTLKSASDVTSAGITIPTGFTFAGWSTSANSTTTVSSVEVTANTTLYAVLVPTGAGYQLITSASQITSGTYLIGAFGSTTAPNPLKYRLATGDINGGDMTVQGTGTSATNGLIETKPNDACEFILSGNNTDGFTIVKGSDYLGSSAASNRKLAWGDYSSYLWKFTDKKFNDDIEGGVYMQCTVSSTTYRVSDNGTSGNDVIRSYTSNTVGRGFYLFKKIEVTPYTRVYTGTNNAIADITISGPTLITSNSVLNMGSHNLECDDAANLIIEEGGQLILPKTNKGVQATVKKETYAATAEAKTDYYWYAISSAVANPSIASATNIASGTYDLYRYNETKNAGLPWENYKNTAYSSAFTTLEPGRGYLYRNASDLSIAMTGEINVADFNYEVTKTGSGVLAGFNLIGNPYSHDIYKGAGTAIPNGSDFLRTGFYYMNPADGSWTPGTDGNTVIKPNEGILVQTDKSGNIEMTNTNSNGAKYNNDNIMFKVANSQYSDETYAWFDKGRGLNKISHRNAEVPMIYINQDGEDYAIATMSDETKVFSLNFKAMTMGKYTLSYKTRGEFNYLHVIDRLTGEDVDMLLEGEYSFVASPSDSDARFIVKLAYLPDYSDDEGDIFAYQNGSDIFVSGEGELQIFDVMGRFVMSERINGVKTISADELSKGVYVLRLVGNGMKTQKIVVK